MQGLTVLYDIQLYSCMYIDRPTQFTNNISKTTRELGSTNVNEHFTKTRSESKCRFFSKSDMSGMVVLVQAGHCALWSGLDLLYHSTQAPSYTLTSFFPQRYAPRTSTQALTPTACNNGEMLCLLRKTLYKNES